MSNVIEKTLANRFLRQGGMVKRLDKLMVGCAVVMGLMVQSLPAWADFFKPDVCVNDVTAGKQNTDGTRVIATCGDSVYVVWASTRVGDTTNVYFAKSTDRGETFLPSVMVSSVPDTLFQGWPCIAVDGSGNVCVAWTVTSLDLATVCGVYFAKSTDGGASFNSAIVADSFGILPAMGVHGSNVYVLSVHPTGYPLFDIYLSRSTDGGSAFESPYQVNDAACQDVNVRWESMITLCVDDVGNIYAAWNDGRRNGANGDIYFAKSTDSGVSFGANLPVSDTTSPAGDSTQFGPSIAASGSDVYVAWADHRGGRDDSTRVYLASLSNGSANFCADVPVSDTLDEAWANPPAVAASSSRLWIVYASIKSGQQRLGCVNSCDGGMTFRRNIVVSDTHDVSSQCPSCVIGLGDSLCVAWGDCRLDEPGENRDVYFSKGDYRGFSGHVAANTTWSQDVFVSGDVWVDSAVTLTISPGVTVTFDAHNDDQHYFYSAADTSDTALCSIWILDTTSSFSAVGGAKADSIVFTSDGAPKNSGDWGMIAGFGGLDLRYCDIGYNKDVVGLTDLNVEHCRIHDCSDRALSHNGAEMGYSDAGTLTYNTIYNTETGIGVSGGNHTITHNIIHDCGERGIDVWGSGTSTIDSNSVTNCSQAAITLEDSVTPNITRNQITGNDCGIQVNGNANPIIGGSLVVANDIYGNTSRNIRNERSDTVKAEYNHWGALTNNTIWATMGGSHPELIDYIPWTNAAHDSAYYPFLGPVWWVSITGDDVMGNGSLPNPYRTITKGLSVASSGDTVMVCPGTYDQSGGENFPLNMPNGIVLMSQKGRDSTTIRPNSKSKVSFRAINCDGVNTSTVISGFSIVGGESGSRGGGILCYNGATPQITFNRFSDNISYQGAAICCEYGSNATISDNIFTSNNSDFGSGVHCFESSPIIRNNDFTGNTGPGGYTMGVIACDMSSSPIVSGNTFTRSKGRAMYYTNGSGGLIRDNTVTGDTLPGGWRGACLFCGSGSVPQIISNTFSHNRAPVGAGIYLEMGSSATIDSNTFTSNSADTGAGIYCDFSAPDISNNTFTNNLGGLEGGYTEAVIYCDFSQAGTQMMGNTITGTKGRGIYFNNNSAGDVVGNTIIGDTLPTVSTWDGAGMYCNNGSLPTIRGNTLSENRAVNGGAIACRNGADPTITSNTITGNRAEIPGAEGFGGGIFVYGGSATITMDSNTVTGNSARWGGGIACYQSGGASVRILHNLVKSNTADSVGGGISCYQSSPWILRNNVIENRAHYGGAISCRHMSGPTIQVCVIERNIANNLGGGIYCTDHCDPSIVDNTIVGNVSASSSGICSADSSKPGIERNAIMDNACGVHFLPTSGLMGFVGANNIYYNTYQPAPTDYDVINETAGTANFPNSWWGTSDSATVDGNIDGDVAFMPILSAPAPTGCGEPSAVTSVTIYGDAGYSGELVETDIGDTVYIELMGTDWRSSTRDPAMVILESQIDAYGIGLALVETEVHNGCYHGYAVVDTASNDLYNHIAADTNGFIVVRSNVGSVCDTVYMPVAAPVMIAEPTYTPDTINTVHWTSASNEYYAECDTNSSFGSIHSSSGWITDTFFTFTSLDNDVTYYYRAKTRNSALVESDWSNTVSSTQDAVSPTISSLTPQDGAYLSTTVFPVSARYVDTPSSGIDTSSVVIRIDGGDVTSQATVTDSMVSYTPASPLSDTIHVAFVKVGDNVGNVDSATWSFEVDTTEPVSPVLLSPDDSIWFNDTTIAFEWGTVAKLAPVKYVATSYKASTRLMHFKVKASPMRYVFQADTSASFGSPMIVDTTVLTVDTLNFSSDKYYWRVCGLDSAGNAGEFATPFWFGVDTTDPYITTVFPSLDTLITDSLPTITARYDDALSGIDMTQVKLTVDGSLVAATVTDSMVSYTPTIALADTIHSATVHVWDNAGNPDSISWTFEIDANAPAMPALVQPIAGVWQDSLSVYFEWTGVTKSAKRSVGQGFSLANAGKSYSNERNDLGDPKNTTIYYVIQADTTAAFAAPVLTDTTGNTDYEITLFESGFYWKVMAYDSAGNQGQWTLADSFGVDTTDPVIDSTTAWDDTTNFWGPFEVETNASDNFSFHNPVMFHRTSVDTEWVADTMVSIGNGWHVDSIPAQTPRDSIIIDYYLSLEDIAGNNSRDPGAGWYSFIARVKPYIEREEMVAPVAFSLSQNRPNPFSGLTEIKYGIPKETDVEIAIYSISGQKIATLLNEHRKPGYYTVIWDGRDGSARQVTSGVYFYRLRAGDHVTTRKMYLANRKE